MRKTWIQIKSEGDFNLAQDGVRVKKGCYQGLGWYLELCYSQLCPRGCCYDQVIELITANEQVEYIKDKMRDLAWDLKTAREKR